jgi:hypothetical protein
MVNWTKIHNELWIIKKGERVFRIHNIEKLIVYSLAMGIDIDEIEYALLELNKLDHNYASFGIWNTFICTEKI